MTNPLMNRLYIEFDIAQSCKMLYYKDHTKIYGKVWNILVGQEIYI